MTLGSCFADNMAAELLRAKFRVTANPAGVLFNPASIALMLGMFDQATPVSRQELACDGGRWFDYRFHGSLAALSADEALQKMNAAVETGHRALREADTVIITFGTAWVYTLNATGQTAANCHKQPQSLFTKRRMSVNEIVAQFGQLLEGVLKEKSVIFTVSPVRHLADGFDENFLSKATLKLAVAELVAAHENALYFPAYEIVNDDLRDYRFYADDLVHPSAQAVAYIREKFFGAALDAEAAVALPKVVKIVAAAAHRPFNADDPAFVEFCRTNLQRISELEESVAGLDLSAERRYFAGCVQ